MEATSRLGDDSRCAQILALIVKYIDEVSAEPSFCSEMLAVKMAILKEFLASPFFCRTRHELDIAASGRTVRFSNKVCRVELAKRVLNQGLFARRKKYQVISHLTANRHNVYVWYPYPETVHAVMTEIRLELRSWTFCTRVALSRHDRVRNLYCAMWGHWNRFLAYGQLLFDSKLRFLANHFSDVWVSETRLCFCVLGVQTRPPQYWDVRSVCSTERQVRNRL